MNDAGLAVGTRSGSNVMRRRCVALAGASTLEPHRVLGTEKSTMQPLALAGTQLQAWV
jgi:hypothetical protein